MLTDRDLAFVVLSPLFAFAFITSLLYCIIHEIINPLRFLKFFFFTSNLNFILLNLGNNGSKKRVQMKNHYWKMIKLSEFKILFDFVFFFCSFLL